MGSQNPISTEVQDNNPLVCLIIANFLCQSNFKF